MAILTHKTSSRRSARLPRRVKISLDDFRRRVIRLFPGEISQIILYGSYARGEATRDSDVDILVVVKWSDPQNPGGYYWGRLSDPRWQVIINAAMDAMPAEGPYFSTLVIGEDLIDEDVPVIEAARREGKTLWKSRPI
jgi:hypothetical protein